VYLTDRDGKIEPLAALDRVKVAAFCGLGNPNNFRHTLSRGNWELVAWQEYPDHHHYTEQDADSLLRYCESSAVEAVLCTHKDLVKIGPLWQSTLPLYAVMLETEVLRGSDRLQALLQRCVDRGNLRVEGLAQ